MGSDDIFHKRRARAAAELNRRRSVRASYDKVLIVCEGEKTEPLYFRELIDYYKIHSANVRVSCDCGSDPVSVVNHGIELYEHEKRTGSGPFDSVYFVFDRDAHPNYQQATERLNNLKHQKPFFSANSVPCFEYWLLLHFTYTTAPYSAVGGTSAGAAVLKDLKTYWPEYAKAGHGTFSATLSKLGFAKANAKRACTEADNNHTDNPSTYVHKLVEYLQELKNPKSE
ncbi:RloB family protein [Candidatus Accumulibacter contiguus]|jgi:hypothetical protein|uniref:RloB family protein n=1 Tax=Candidatus Accumulibacter contiguus TaxID=2954381 RepID=UPI002FC31609